MAQSPFPGMDPFLESHWRDVHSRLVAYGADALAEVLPDDLIARMEERVAIESEEDLRRLVAPDVRVFEAAPQTVASHVGPGSAGAFSVAVPVLLTAVVEPLTERFIQIIEAESGKLITVVEFLSPTNKRRGEGMRDYRAKRRQLLDSGVNVVEVDLVRQGDWLGLLMPFAAPAKHQTAYRALVRRAAKAGEVELYPVTLRQRLPAIPIPLRGADDEVALDLQALLDRAYANGRYDRTTDYSRECDPPLDGPDRAWAEELLRGAGRR